MWSERPCRVRGDWVKAEWRACGGAWGLRRQLNRA